MDISNDDARGLLKIGGIIDISTAGALRDVLKENLDRPAALALDLSNVEECDTAALQMLFAALRTAARDKKVFHLTALSAAVLDTAGILGLPVEELSSKRYEASGGI